MHCLDFRLLLLQSRTENLKFSHPVRILFSTLLKKSLFVPPPGKVPCKSCETLLGRSSYNSFFLFEGQKKIHKVHPPVPLTVVQGTRCRTMSSSLSRILWSSLIPPGKGRSPIHKGSRRTCVGSLRRLDSDDTQVLPPYCVVTGGTWRTDPDTSGLP